MHTPELPKLDTDTSATMKNPQTTYESTRHSYLRALSKGSMDG